MTSLFDIRHLARIAASRFAASRRRRETLRVIEGLPPHIRKDIGYPGPIDVSNLR